MYIRSMVNPLLKSLGLTGKQLAKLTGQDANTVSRKSQQSQGLSFGAREAGILACYKIMTPDQRKCVEETFQEILEGFGSKK